MMLLRIIFVFLVYIAQTNVWASSKKVGFSSPEHIALGDDVVLRLSISDPGHSNASLHLANGLVLSYGTILALGDFYGTVGQAISLGQTHALQQARFLKAFEAFAVKSDVLSELPKIVRTFQAEREVIQGGIQRKESEKVIMDKIGLKFDKEYNCITGGGCSQSTWWMYPGRYLLLANDNFDHFGDNAWVTYQIGHEMAITEAIQAYQEGSTQRLEMAYAMNAFASHFLSDRFASGHMRTPRLQLAQKATSSFVASLLTGLMHNEENYYGLHVHNNRGEQWVAYGDKTYFFPKSTIHNAKQHKVLQHSADAIFFAYQYGYAPDESYLEDLIPYPDETAPNVNQDIAPIFYWDEKTNQLMRRQDLNDPYDAHWTSYWWSWATLVESGLRK